MPRTTKAAATPAKAPKKRDREVLDAAARVFYERGYSDASVQDIADELGILKGSLYHYIDSKEDLLFRLLVDTHDEVQAILDEVVAIEGLAPLERLRLYITKSVEFTTRNLARMAIYYHDFDQLSETRHKELTKKRHAHEQFVQGLIVEAQKAGDVAADVDPILTTNYLFGSMIWVY